MINFVLKIYLDYRGVELEYKVDDNIDEYKGLDFLNERIQKLRRGFFRTLVACSCALPCDEVCISIYR